MRLTVYTDFTLRTLMYLAVHPDRLPTIPEIAAKYAISKNHLMKVVHQLGLAGYVVPVRGKNGGLRLARPPSSMNLGAIVRHTAPDMALVPCFDPVKAFCTVSPACKLRHALHEARAAFLAVLDRYTVADLTANADELVTLLETVRPPA